jgi:hypothetical protein
MTHSDRRGGSRAAEAARTCLQQRDIDLLVDLHSFGCMLRGQIQALYFGSVQRTNARLLRLLRARYVSRAVLPLPTCMGIPNGSQAAYMLGVAGIPVVASRMGIDPTEVRRQQRHGTPAYVSHTVEVVQFRLALEDAARSDPTANVDRFLPERLCQHAYQYREGGQEESGEGPWRKEVYKPDAVFLLSWPDGAAGFALEIDLGHTGTAALAATFRIHARYAASGLFEKRYLVEKARTLLVTTSAARRDHLKALAAKEGSRRFWFSTFAELAAGGVLGPVWHAPFESVPQRLADGATWPVRDTEGVTR